MIKKNDDFFRQPSVAFVFISLALFLMQACKKNAAETAHLNHKAFLQNFYQKLRAGTDTTVLFNALKLNWQNTYQTQTGTAIVLEVPVSNPQQIISVQKGSLGDYDTKAARTYTKLVILDNNGSKNAFFMVLDGVASVPISQLHYGNLSDFTGTINYYNTDNTFNNGYNIIEGKITQTFTLKQGDLLLSLKESARLSERHSGGKLMNAPAPSCTDHTVDVYQQTCITATVTPGPVTNAITPQTNKAARLMSSTTTCWYEYSVTYFISICDTGGGGQSAPVYIPHGGSYTDGTTTAPTKIITTDTSVLNNEKAKCALNKLLGKNKVFDSLLNKFTGDGYNVTFKVKDILAGDKPNKNPARAETTYNPSSKTNMYIQLRRSYVNGSPPIQIAKTLLHEAFHANLMQRAYDVFGSFEINNNWPVKPEDLSLKDLMDVYESKLAGTTREAVEHQYIAQNINILVAGLKQFAKDYDANYLSYDEYDYLSLAWEGLIETQYFKDTIKYTQLYYVPNTGVHMRADSLFSIKSNNIKTDSQVSCGLVINVE